MTDKQKALVPHNWRTRAKMPLRGATTICPERDSTGSFLISNLDEMRRKPQRANGRNPKKAGGRDYYLSPREAATHTGCH